MRREEHVARVAEVLTDVQYLIQQIAQSVVSKHVSASIRSSSRRVHTKNTNIEHSVERVHM
jgi:hypothetical protein